MLAVTDYEHPFFEVHVRPSKGKGFASTETGAEAQPNQGFEPPVICGCSSGALAHLAVRVNGLE